MADPRRRFLLVPAGGRGEGMGHLVRCVGLARRLGRGCAFHPGWLDVGAREALQSMLGRIAPRDRPGIIDAGTERRTWGIVIVDRRRTSRADLATLERFGTVVCEAARVRNQGLSGAIAVSGCRGCDCGC